MKISITHDFRFEAAHCLPRLPADHKCSRMHGHSYVVTLHLRGPLDHRGFVVDYDELEVAWRPVHEAIDHQVLNEIPGLEVPSTEVLATWILTRMLLPERGNGAAVDYAKRQEVAKVLRAVSVNEAISTSAKAALDDLRDHPELLREGCVKTSLRLCGSDARDDIGERE